ncbi:MAG TPA: hypothetical protein VF440_03075 [Novosphingobium sp.]
MAYGYLTPATWQRKLAERGHGTGSLLFDQERRAIGGFADRAGDRSAMPAKGGGKPRRAD